MKERPILFSASMVRAILDGSKTQTRRVVKDVPGWVELFGYSMFTPKRSISARGDRLGKEMFIRCPYGQPGDRLSVAMNIPSVGRNYCAGSNGAIYSRSRGDWRPLKAHGGVGAYPSVTVMVSGRKTTRAVHSLVCEAFYGVSPFPGAQVRHLDGDVKNSKPSNLAWGTQAENWKDRRCRGNGIEGEKHHASKLSDIERSHVRWAIEKGLCSQRHAARMLNMSQPAIGQLLAGIETATILQDIPDNRVPPIILEITGMRVERLQDITRSDIRAEGLQCPPELCSDEVSPNYRDYYPKAWRELWEQINGAGSWALNPWVWVVGFKRVDK